MVEVGVRSSRQLYRHLLHLVNRLPEKEMQEYYYNYVRQQFKSHSDESDPERIRQIIDRAVKDAEWILKKYKVSATPSALSPKKL